ncbi:hypothetical protein EDD85DRAFT_800944 [Armillaria nabsnona]|nr:hypothetical protein EDD85DRAFT_800944 [Armillaria nabsnona]
MIPSHINCNSCSLAILPSKPRVHCLSCLDYDLCADCPLCERSTGQRDSSHRTQIYRVSGGGDLPPLLSEIVSLTYIIPVRQSPTSSISPSSPTTSSIVRPTDPLAAESVLARSHHLHIFLELIHRMSPLIAARC